MQRKINHDDFERFLQENADQVRMYPSSAVWKNISKDLNRRKRRLVAFLAALMLRRIPAAVLIDPRLPSAGSSPR